MSNRKRKTPPPKLLPKKTCLKCQKEKSIINYYNANSAINNPDGKMNICKNCLMQMVNVDDLNSVENVLRQIDKPFIYFLWEQCLEKESPFGHYLRQINSLPQYKSLTWSDGDGSQKNKSKSVEQNNTVTTTLPPSLRKVDPEMVTKWGVGYKPDDYFKLEDFYMDMTRSYEIETASHKDYLKKICKVSLKMEQAIDDGRIDEFKKLSDAYDKLMHSAKFTAVQRSAADRTGGLNTFGEFFEYIEKEGFIPKFHTDEPQDVVDVTIDNLMKFTRTLVLGDPNLANIVEQTLAKMKNEEEDEVEALDADELDENGYEDHYVDLTANELGENDEQL